MTNLTGLLSLLLISAMTLNATVTEESSAKSPAVQNEQSILIFYKTGGWQHDSIETGVKALTLWAEEKGVSVLSTDDASVFTDDELKQFDSVIFMNTTETLFDDEQRGAFKRYIQNGGGFTGVHSATDTEYDWPWYNKLVGAYFANHPQIQPAVLNVVDGNHRSTEMLPETWERVDEWYNFKDFNDDVTVLITLDPESFEGSDHPDKHPIAWYHEFDGGRSFYTGLGHTHESYSEDLFMQHLWGGIEYTMGKGE